MKLPSLLQIFGGEHLAAIELLRGVFERIRHPVVHAEIEIAHHEDRSLEALGQIEGVDRHVEAFRDAGRQQHDVLRVAVGAVDHRENVRLLRACRKTRAGSDARDIEDHDGNLRVVGQADELVHQRDAGARRRRHRAGARPSGADRHADCRQFVFSLHDRVGRFAVLFVTIVPHVVREGFAKTRRGRNRIPGRNRDSGEHAAQRRRGVAVDDDLAFGRIHPLATIGNHAAIQVLRRVLASHFQRLLVQRDGLRLAFELLLQRNFHLGRIDVQQLAHNADINHVGQKLAQP